MNDRYRIYVGKAEDRECLVSVLARNGYTVRIGKEKIAGGKTYSFYVEYWKEAGL